MLAGLCGEIIYATSLFPHQKTVQDNGIMAQMAFLTRGLGEGIVLGFPPICVPD